MVDQHALPLWAGDNEPSDHRPLFHVDERVGSVSDRSWRGTVVQVVRDRASGRNHFLVVWTVGRPGGPFEYTATALYRLPKPSAGRRRTERQGAHLAAGMHPLTAALGWALRLHTEAAPAADRNGPGRRCGTCRFREVLAYHNRAYGKCTFGDGHRITHGPGTDVRAWWPACTDHQPKDQP